MQGRAGLKNDLWVFINDNILGSQCYRRSNGKRNLMVFRGGATSMDSPSWTAVRQGYLCLNGGRPGPAKYLEFMFRRPRLFGLDGRFSNFTHEIGS